MEIKEKQFCKNLLNLHQEGVKIGSYLKARSKIIFIYIFFLLFNIYSFYSTGFSGFLLLIGLIIGILLQDLQWIYRIKKAWPLTDKVTDWEKVKKLAED